MLVEVQNRPREEREWERRGSFGGVTETEKRERRAEAEELAGLRREG